MKFRVLLLTFAIGLFILLAASCNPQPLPEEPTPIPTLIPATPPPEPTTAPQAAPPMAESGTEVFNMNCSACHNLDATQKVGPGLAGMFGREALPNGSPVTDDNLKEWIRNGGGAMPGVPLSDDQLEVLLDFLKETTQAEAAEPAQPTSPPEPSQSMADLGSQVYSTNCAVCHNLDATQKVGPGLAGMFDKEALPNGNPITDDNLKEWIQQGGGAMPGVPLPDDELKALITFLEGATQ